MGRSSWVIDETKDLEMLLRIAVGARYAVSFFEDELSEDEQNSLDRLCTYDLARLRVVTPTRVKSDEYRVRLLYALTRKGKQAYSDVLDGFEKHLPGPGER